VTPKEQPMKCYQCHNPAMFLVTEKEIPLCLDCNLKFVQMIARQNEMHEREINYLSDYMDSIVGVSAGAPRFPERKSVHVGGVSLNNIRVDNSTIGVINTGNMETVDLSVSALAQEGQADLAAALTNLTNAVLSNNDIHIDIKNQIVEILSIISSEATAPPEKRRNSVAETLLSHLERLLRLSNQLGEVWERWGPTIRAAFGS
jgi:hypothetical protein